MRVTKHVKWIIAVYMRQLPKLPRKGKKKWKKNITKFYNGIERTGLLEKFERWHFPTKDGVGISVLNRK